MINTRLPGRLSPSISELAHADRSVATTRRSRLVAVGVVGFTIAAIATSAVIGFAGHTSAQGTRTLQIDGDAVLAGRSMDPRFDKVLRAVNQYAYIVVNPANGPEAVDGQDLDADGYAGPNPNVEDFVLRVKQLGAGSTKALGYLPKSRGEAVAVDYKRVGTDGVFLAGYSCGEATAAIATISASWSGAVIVIGTAGCTGGAGSVNTADPAQFTLVDASASNVPTGSLDPYASYPTSSGSKLGIPAYFTDSVSWDRLLAGISDVGAITINQSELTVIRSKVQAVRAGGAKVYVYVPTGYLTKNPANAGAASGRIATALADPDIDGVFLDEVRSGCSDRAITDYTAMFNQATAAGKKLVYNPGQTAGSCFNAVSNASVNFEGTAGSFMNWPASEWGRNLGSDRMWQIIHGAAMSDIPQIALLAKQRNAGLIWVAPTDQWTQFPDSAYFDAVRLAVRGTLTPPARTTTTTGATTTPSSTTTTTVPALTTTTAVGQTTTTTALSATTTSIVALSAGAVTTTTTFAPSTSVSPTTTSLSPSTTTVARGGTTTSASSPSSPPTTLVAAPLIAPTSSPVLNATLSAGLPVAPRAKASRRRLSYTG